WDHHLSQSLAPYRALVARDPHDIEALLGQARVLSWQDQLSPSLRDYKHILALDPGNLEARENIARVQSWRGRQRVAHKLADAVLADHADDLSAALTRANSELWMGRPNRAALDERVLLRNHPTDSGVRNLANDLSDQRMPQLRIASSTANSSDGLNIRSTTFENEYPIDQGASSFGVRYEPISYVGNSSEGSATERRIGLFAHDRLSDLVELHGTVQNDEVSVTGVANRKLLLYDTYLTLYPNDTLRFDFGQRQESFDNVVSLRMGLTAVFDTASLDITPDENTRLSVRANQGRYTDGNRRGWEQVEFERAVLRKPRLSFGARTTGYSFSQNLYDG
ncbi:MAG: hypothetical protein IAI49_06820, partial [Candidatus Eremiobacteraeota bacterium]|nr:hypothetical protein [Candidatus Eremiobacteraeota bacterium]